VTPRRVGIPRLNDDTVLTVVRTLVEIVDELQGAVGSPDQRAVRLGELQRIGVVKSTPTGGTAAGAGGNSSPPTRWGEIVGDFPDQQDAVDYVAAQIAAHEAEADPHPQYITDAAAAEYTDQQIEQHEAAVDPHPQYLRSGVAGATFDGSNATLVPLSFCDVRVPYRAQVIRVTLLADTATTTAVDVRRSTLAAFPPVAGGSICGAAKPTLSAASAYEDGTLTGWSTIIEAGDVLRFVVESNTLATKLMVALELRRA